jgi:hypothetical protein
VRTLLDGENTPKTKPPRPKPRPPKRPPRRPAPDVAGEGDTAVPVPRKVSAPAPGSADSGGPPADTTTTPPDTRTEGETRVSGRDADGPTAITEATANGAGLSGSGSSPAPSTTTGTVEEPEPVPRSTPEPEPEPKNEPAARTRPGSDMTGSTRSTQPGKVQPDSTQPGKAQPDSTQPGKAQPITTEPVKGGPPAPEPDKVSAASEQALVNAVPTSSIGPGEPAPVEGHPLDKVPTRRAAPVVQPPTAAHVDAPPDLVEHDQTQHDQAEPVDAPPTQAKHVDTPPTQAKPVDAPPTQAEPVDTPPTQAEPVDTPPTQAEPVDTPPTQAKPVDTPPTQTEHDLPAEVPPAQDPAVLRRRDRDRRHTRNFLIVLTTTVGVGLVAYTFWLGAWAWPFGSGRQPGCLPGTPTPTAAPVKQTSVRVYNATDRRGLALNVAKDLQKRGFLVPTWDNETGSAKLKAPAEVRYGPDGLLNARTVAAQVTGKALLVLEAHREGPTVDLVLGRAFSKLRSPAEAAKLIAMPTDVPDICPSGAPAGAGAAFFAPGPSTPARQGTSAGPAHPSPAALR